ncbi:glycosyltransferase family 9 protein [Mailhella massiliensis]|uniref:Glycosyltransferase family 9 protein n=1 Tax=Mailhella massiliensis TaxID=1903261 RepID=A0A921DR74_9BACT|nr:glycosyltransferase family 9 protein [Mailhella massiliensis]HJD97339.1 glycosyltransferase family 9 protein [Mailhella massiliensis]
MRIAVWNTAFLGDSVLTLPLIRTLKAAWPEAEVDFYVRGGLAALYEAQPELAHVYACDKRGKDRGFAAVRRQGREVAERRYDIWVDAHLSLRSSFMAWASRAPVRAGYREACLSRLAFTRSVGRRFHELQEIERLLLLAEAIGVPSAVLENEALHWPELVLPAHAHEQAKELLGPLPEGPAIGIHPGSVWSTKRWTPEGFAFILRRALSRGVNVVLLAGPGEESTVAKVRALAGVEEGEAHFLDLSGKTSLLSLAAVLGRLDDYVTNDSGPMHLAWAQHTPVTALFGPTVRALGFTPRGERSSVLEVELPCRPCGLHGHKACPKGHFDCMKRIDPEAVWRDVEIKLTAQTQE